MGFRNHGRETVPLSLQVALEGIIALIYGAVGVQQALKFINSGQRLPKHLQDKQKIEIDVENISPAQPRLMFLRTGQFVHELLIVF